MKMTRYNTINVTRRAQKEGLAERHSDRVYISLRIIYATAKRPPVKSQVRSEPRYFFIECAAARLGIDKTIKRLEKKNVWLLATCCPLVN